MDESLCSEGQCDKKDDVSPPPHPCLAACAVQTRCVPFDWAEKTTDMGGKTPNSTNDRSDRWRR